MSGQYQNRDEKNLIIQILNNLKGYVYKIIIENFNSLIKTHILNLQTKNHKIYNL